MKILRRISLVFMYFVGAVYLFTLDEYGIGGTICLAGTIVTIVTLHKLGAYLPPEKKNGSIE